MRLRLILCCVGFLFVFPSCAMQLEHCAPRSYKSKQVDCFPVGNPYLTSAKIFIQRLYERDDLILETDHWRLVLIKNQALLGSAKIRLKRACGTLAGLAPEEQAEFFQIIRTYERAVREAFRATHVNLACLMNYAYQEKPWTPAVHCWLTPRYEKPVEHFGRVFIDRTFGYKKKDDPPIYLSKKERGILIEEFRKAL